jgi:phenylpropionate dioxygenase-like ring-hydroxylating dioxygenase large terminal subunit
MAGMKPATQRELLHRFFLMHEQHTTMLAPEPYRQRASVYTDPERLQAEQRGLFRGQPLLVALSGDLPSTGDYLATEVAGVPLLLVRGEDAEVRGFLNICRHRGGRVATGRGAPGRAFKCPYHSWAYDLNGELLGQPLARDAFEGIDRCELGLKTVPIAERYGVIMARLGSDAPIDVDAELHGLGPELASYDFDSFRFFEERSGIFEANWKLIHDTFLESYHIFSLHRNTIAGDLLSTPFVADLFGPHARGAVMRKEVVKLLELDESEWNLRTNASIVYLIFPSTLINLPISGHAELWEMYPEPDDPHRTRVTVRFYSPGEPRSEEERKFWETNVKFTTEVVFREDFDQQQDIHRSLRTGLMPEVVYGRNEPMLIHHHEQIELALSTARLPSA